MRFEPAPEYEVFPTKGRQLKPYEAAVRAAGETQPLIRDVNPDVVVADILTVAAALAAELEGRPWATLVPHVMPLSEPGFPPYSIGARLPRTPLGSALWRLTDPIVRLGIERGRVELNETRKRLGLAPLDHVHGGMSRELAIVATFPQLEYPRHTSWPWMRVTGPLIYERPTEDVELPPGEEPLVLVAPSTSQDTEQRMLRTSLAGLAGEPVRVLATTNVRGDASVAGAVPDNARVVDWLSYERVMPHCAAVVCHAGHGTVMRALSCGVPLVACPAAGDMAENAARVTWAGVGVSLPRRLVSARGIKLAVRRLLADDSYTARTRDLAAWAERNDGSKRAADVMEDFTA